MAENAWSVEPHGDGWALYLGRDTEHHGARICNLSDGTPGDYEQIANALNALRQQEGMVCDWSFLRSVLAQGADIHKDYMAGNHASYEEYSARLDAAARERHALLAASERDQRGADSQNQITEQVTTQDCDSAVTQSALHHFRPSTLCESLYVLKARLSDHLSPAEQRDLDEAIEAISNSDLLRGIALGLEAVLGVLQKYRRLRYTASVIRRSLNPADIAAKAAEKG